MHIDTQRRIVFTAMYATIIGINTLIYATIAAAFPKHVAPLLSLAGVAQALVLLCVSCLLFYLMTWADDWLGWTVNGSDLKRNLVISFGANPVGIILLSAVAFVRLICLAAIEMAEKTPLALGIAFTFVLVAVLFGTGVIGK